uniref:Uncharacterized protein n=1 Tax=Caenorhabditis japonica TaxID=281687 RepID=A0A8R1IQB4_CAEJA
MIPAGRGAVHSNHTPVLGKPADYAENINDTKIEEVEVEEVEVEEVEVQEVEVEVEEVEVEEIEVDEKSQGRGEVETHPPPAQVDVTELPTEAIVRMRELPAHMITSEVHPFASSYVEPIKKMDPPDSAAKRISYYCTLDMIQASRNKSITDAEPSTRPAQR